MSYRWLTGWWDDRESPLDRAGWLAAALAGWVRFWWWGWRSPAGLAVSSALDYAHNEQRLTSLQTKLTASVLQTAQPQLQTILGRVVGLTAMATDPGTAFRAAMAAELAPRGPFASATVAVVQGGQVSVLGHVGSAPIQGLDSSATTQLFLRAARTTSLVTSRVVGGGVQKLGYLLSARGVRGVYVVGAAQQLPVGRRISVPAGSPYASLDFALYFGPSPAPAALIETNVGHLPLTGTVSKATVPFGDNVLTLVASPRGPLAGTWAQYLPWGIAGLGILLSVAAAGVAENLVRRRRTAEGLYQQQRNMSETLQRSLLPRRLPAVPDWEFAARYVPATKVRRSVAIGTAWWKSTTTASWSWSGTCPATTWPRPGSWPRCATPFAPWPNWGSLRAKY